MHLKIVDREWSFDHIWLFRRGLGWRPIRHLDAGSEPFQHTSPTGDVRCAPCIEQTASL